MADSETVVAQTSELVGYTAAGYVLTGYADSTTNLVPHPGACRSMIAGDFVSPTSADTGNGNADVSDRNSIKQGFHVGEVDELKAASSQNGYVLENSATETSEAVGRDSSLNGSVTAEPVDATSVENGNVVENSNGASEEQHFADGSG